VKKGEGKEREEKGREGKGIEVNPEGIEREERGRDEKWRKIDFCFARIPDRSRVRIPQTRWKTNESTSVAKLTATEANTPPHASLAQASNL
jgi:hypothetical protein